MNCAYCHEEMEETSVVVIIHYHHDEIKDEHWNFCTLYHAFLVLRKEFPHELRKGTATDD